MSQGIRKIGVIGAGQMGNGIAHVCALAGFPVLINDVSPDRIKDALATINGNMARQISKKRITEQERQSALGHIAPATTFDKFGDCDLVIEAVTEREDVKRKTLSQLCPMLKPEAIIGTNTSSISITRLAAAMHDIQLDTIHMMKLAMKGNIFHCQKTTHDLNCLAHGGQRLAAFNAHITRQRVPPCTDATDHTVGGKVV